MSNVLFLAGSIRADSVNKKLAQAATKIATAAGVNATFIDLKDFPMPLYDEDTEAKSGMPEAAKKLKHLFQAHDGIFIASPEYNSSFSAVLKNAIDWISRPESKEEPMLSAFSGKVVALGAASPGALGGLRGLVPLRMLLGNINMHVIPAQVAIGGAFSAFSDDGSLADAKQHAMLEGVVHQLMTTTQALSA